MTEAEVASLLAYLGAVYPHAEITPEMVSAYHDLLQDLPAGNVMEAAKGLAKTETFLPSVGQIRRAIAHDALNLRTAEAELHRIEAEAEVRYSPAVGNIVDFSAVPMGTVTVRAFSAAGARPDLTDEIEWWRRRFIKAYRENAERAVEQFARGEIDVAQLPSGEVRIKDEPRLGGMRSVGQIMGGMTPREEQR